MPNLEEQLTAAKRSLSKVEGCMGGKIRRRGELERSLQRIAKARSPETRQKLDEYHKLIREIEELQRQAAEIRRQISSLRERIAKRKK